MHASIQPIHTANLCGPSLPPKGARFTDSLWGTLELRCEPEPDGRTVFWWTSSSRKSCNEACRESSSPHKVLNTADAAHLDPKSDRRSIPLGPRPARSRTCFHSRSRVVGLNMKAEPTYRPVAHQPLTRRRVFLPRARTRPDHSFKASSHAGQLYKLVVLNGSHWPFSFRDQNSGTVLAPQRLPSISPDRDQEVKLSLGLRYRGTPPGECSFNAATLLPLALVTRQ